MKRKLFSAFLACVFMLAGFASVSIKHASAQTFPDGCASAIGYSTTTGNTCSGTSQVTTLPAGCATPMGYSTTNGEPCSGTDEALTFLNGCASFYGYSTVSGQPCNGTTVASFPPVSVPPTSTPGFPTTGEGGNAFRNIALLLAAGALALVALRAEKGEKIA